MKRENMTKRSTLFQTGELVQPVETVPTPGAVVSLGDDRLLAAARLTGFLVLLAADVGAIIDYHEVITAHMPLLLGMVALAVGCVVGAAFHLVPDFVWQRRTIQRTASLYDDYMARRNVALGLALEREGDEADLLPGEEVSTGPDLGQIHAAAYRILYRHYALKRETTREVCQTEEGITQPVWNAVNERLKLAGIRPTGRNWDQGLTFATAWARWLQAEAPRLATWEMASRRPASSP